MKSLLFTGMSFLLTSLVIGNAYYQKQQFYPSVVYITKSNPSMAVIYIQALVFVILTAKMLRKLFFGQLRAAEMEHLIERSWYAVTETCLAFTVFRDDFSPRFVALFTLLLFLKCFHWLAEDRIDYMERSPAISWIFHLRALSLIFVLAVLDILFVRHAFYSTILKGPSVQLVFGFEYEILFTVVLMTFIKYVLHTIDLQSENPWDNKAMYLLYSELIMGLIRVLLYILFFAVMVKVHTFPLFAIRPMYLTLRAFQKAASDVILSRRAIRNMNTLYPDATPEELNTGDNLCIICREEMTSGCKKLPCNHILHTNCLRSWFQRQQTCPTCRLEVLRMPQTNSQQRQQQQAQPPQADQQQQQPPAAAQNPFNNMQGLFGGLPFQWPPPNVAGQAVPQPFGWQPQQQQQPQTTTTSGQTTTSAAVSQSGSPSTTAASSETAATSTTTTSTTSASAFPAASIPSSIPPPPFNMGMPFSGMPLMTPPMMPPMFGPMGFPPPPRPMEGLSDEELRAMEGMERANVEARVHWLRDIQTLLDGAMVLIGQYNSVASHMGSPGIQLSTPPNTRTATTSAAAMSSTSSTSSSSLVSSTESSSPLSSPLSASQQQPTWWPVGQGARPKYTSPPSSMQSHNSGKPISSVKSEPDVDSEQVTNGATALDESWGAEKLIPKWEDMRGDENEDESMQEIRKRRLQRFEQSNDVADSNSSQKSNGSADSS